MPYLTGAGEDSHERYLRDRLFTLEEIIPGKSAAIAVDGKHIVLAMNETLTLHHAGEEIRVSLVGFTTRAELRAEASI